MRVMRRIAGGAPQVPLPRSVSGRHCEAHGAPGIALEGPVRDPCICEKVQTCPRVPNEKLVWEQVALKAITGPTGHHQVARDVRSTMREWVDVVDRRRAHFQRMAAINAASAAVAHHRALDCPLSLAGDRVKGAPRKPVNGLPRKGDSGKVMSQHCTSPGKSDAQLREEFPRWASLMVSGDTDRRSPGSSAPSPGS
jgi:hypothetical protein